MEIIAYALLILMVLATVYVFGYENGQRDKKQDKSKYDYFLKRR